MTQHKEFQKMRREYSQHAFNEEDCDKDPFVQFKTWFDHAVAEGVDLPNAMCLSTVSVEGQPSSRVVLLKHYDEKGFVFFTNYDSQKGVELAANPKMTLLFHWKLFDRQIHISGVVTKVSREMSQEYFTSRPRESQVSAIVSPQSQGIPNREHLEEMYASTMEKAKEKEGVSCPANWGGYRVEPFHFEFWQGRDSRLHDRIVYLKNEKIWKILRRSP